MLCCTRAQDCQWHPMVVKISFGVLEMFSLKVFLEESFLNNFFKITTSDFLTI